MYSNSLKEGPRRDGEAWKLYSRARHRKSRGEASGQECVYSVAFPGGRNTLQMSGVVPLSRTQTIMARNLSVEEMVQAEVRRDPKASVEDLHFLAGRIDESIAAMSLAEFREEYLSELSSTPPTRRRGGARKSGTKRKAGTRKKTGTKKTGARKTGSKKTGTKKTGTKKTGTRKRTTKKSTGTRKRSTRKSSGTKKAVEVGSAGATEKAPETTKAAGTRKRTTRKRTTRKRPAKTAAASTPSSGTGSGTEAERVRGVLHAFAQELAGATDPAQAVAVMARVDDYVKQILKS